MRIFIGFIFLLSSSSAFAQFDSTSVPPTEIGLKLHYGTIYIHTKSVKNVSGARPYGVEFDFSRQKKDEATWQRWRTYPRKGLALTYFNFDQSILGHGAMASYFMEPHYRINNTLQFKVRAAFGLVYASNPYDVNKNVTNNSYRTHLNPYMQVGLGFAYRINEDFLLSAWGNFQHFSNGGYNEPNRGVNWVTSSLGLHYSPDNLLPKYKPNDEKPWKNSKVGFDVGVMLLPKQGYSSYLKAQRTFLAGMFVQATKQVTRVSGLTAGTEIYYNKIIETQPTEKNTVASPFLAGIHGGHVFMLGKIDFSQQVGFYLLNQTTYFNNIYYRYGLSYHINKHLAAGLNLKAHYANADFADFRVMYKF